LVDHILANPRWVGWVSDINDMEAAYCRKIDVGKGHIRVMVADYYIAI